MFREKSLRSLPTAPTPTWLLVVVLGSLKEILAVESPDWKMAKVFLFVLPLPTCKGNSGDVVRMPKRSLAES